MNRTRPFEIPVLILILFSLAGCTTADAELKQAHSRIDSLSDLLHRQRIITDSLEKQLSELQNTSTGYPIHFSRKFRQFEDPRSYIKNSLQNKPEEIPLEGVLGGTMQFRKIDILTNQWLLAIYDDGHIQGTSIFDYQLLPNDSLKFSVLLSE